MDVRALNTYIVQPGDTIYSIARNHGLTTEQLLSTNPGIMGRELVLGETIQLPPLTQGRQSIEVNGYVYPNADEAYLNKVLPYLTYLSIIGNRITSSGNLIGVNNREMIETARRANVAPVMVVSNTTENGLYFSGLAHAVLTSSAARDTLITDIVEDVQANNYYGALIDFEFVAPDYFPAYANFLQMLKSALNAQNYKLFIVIRIIVIFSEQAALAQSLPLAEGLTDRFFIRTNEWACNVNLEASVLELTQQAMGFLTQLIPKWKIIIGIPNCCFAVPLPYEPNMQPAQLSVAESERLAAQAGVNFQIDSSTGTMYFQYINDMGTETVVWCPNRSVNQSILELVRIYGLGGVSYRMIEDFPITDYQTLSIIFDIQKVI